MDKTLDAGTKLGRYEIRSLLGKGGMGYKEQALDSLEKAFESGKRDIGLIQLKANPVWEPLHIDPRFQDLLRRVGFTP